MPATVTLYLILVWVCFGLSMGIGWALGNWLMQKLFTAIDSAAAPKA